MKKRLFCFLLAAMLIVGVMPMAALADGTVSGKPGEKVSVTISISGPGFAALQAEIAYDHDALTLDDVTVGSAVAVGGDDDIADLSNGVSLYDNDKLVIFVRADNMTSGTMSLGFTIKDSAAAKDYTVSVRAKEAKAASGDEEQSLDPNAITFTPATITVEEKVTPTHTPGDVNGDGVVDAGDVIRLKDYIKARGRGVEFVSGSLDINGDGNIDAGDVIRLKDYIKARGRGVEIF